MHQFQDRHVNVVDGVALQPSTSTLRMGQSGAARRRVSGCQSVSSLPFLAGVEV